MRRIIALLSLAALFAVLPLLSGCDPAGAGTFELPRETVRFIFDVPGNEMSPGSLTVVQARATSNVNVRALVEARNFSLDDVVSVRISARQPGPEVDLRTPLTAGINHLARVNFRGRVGTSVGPVLLTGSGFTGTASRAPLDIQNPDLSTGLSDDGILAAVLEVEPTNLAVQQPYVIDITFDVVITVEG